MSKTLAELRGQTPSALPPRVMKVCLDLDLLAEVQRLTAEKQDLEVEWRRQKAGDEDGDKPPRRTAQRPPKRLAEIGKALEACWEKMRADEGELLLRARPGGEWLRWKDDHPPREGNDSDERLAFGLCNASDLADDLGRYVKAWNGEDLTSADWSGWLSGRIAPADIGALVQTVVEMHETRISVPKSPSGS